MTDYLHLIRENILQNPDFISATFSGRQRGADMRWKRLNIRPVMIKNALHLQFSFLDETQDITKNYGGDDAITELNAALELPFRNYNIHTQDERIQIILSKKGKPMVSRTILDEAPQFDLAHDRQKNTILTEGDGIPFLRELEMIGKDGRIRADKRSKFNQINNYLRVLAEIDLIETLPEPVRLVDFGCGSAHLTFATYHYLHEILGKQVEITGVDLKEKLINRSNRIAYDLGWHTLRFEHGTIADYQADPPPDIVVALHACDTATDDALAQGARWRSPVILAAPCCHHDLQAQLDAQPTPEVFSPVLRYGLLHERMGDILTDSFRALILRMLGYSVDVMEFVAPDHTPKNLLIRAVRTGEVGSPTVIEEYQRLKDYWQVTPYLHNLLASELEEITHRYHNGGV